MIWYSFRSPDYEMCLLRLQFLYVFWRLHPLVQLEEFTLVWKYVAVRTSRENIGYTNYIERCCSCEIQHVVALGLTGKTFFEAPIIEGEFRHFKLKYKLGWTINDFLWRQGIHQLSTDRWFSHITIYRLNLSGSTGPGGSSFPLVRPANYGSGSARARKEVVAFPANSIKLINFLSFFFLKKFSAKHWA